MSPDIALGPQSGASLGQAASAEKISTQSVGFGASASDIARFEQAMQRANGNQAPVAAMPAAASSGLDSPSLKALMKPFERINSEAAEISKNADMAAGKAELTPGEMIMLTVRCQEFMFHCQLTSNIANRTSDGLQQIFKQQS